MHIDASRLFFTDVTVTEGNNVTLTGGIELETGTDSIVEISIDIMFGAGSTAGWLSCTRMYAYANMVGIYITVY